MLQAVFEHQIDIDPLAMVQAKPNETSHQTHNKNRQDFHGKACEKDGESDEQHQKHVDYLAIQRENLN